MSERQYALWNEVSLNLILQRGSLSLYPDNIWILNFLCISFDQR